MNSVTLTVLVVLCAQTFAYCSCMTSEECFARGRLVGLGDEPCASGEVCCVDAHVGCLSVIQGRSGNLVATDGTCVRPLNSTRRCPPMFAEPDAQQYCFGFGTSCCVQCAYIIPESQQCSNSTTRCFGPPVPSSSTTWTTQCASKACDCRCDVVTKATSECLDADPSNRHLPARCNSTGVLNVHFVGWSKQASSVRSLVRDIRVFVNYRRAKLGERCVGGALVTAVELSAYSASTFAGRVDGVPFALVGDAAFGVPYFRALNNGLACANELALRLADFFQLSSREREHMAIASTVENAAAPPHAAAGKPRVPFLASLSWSSNMSTANIVHRRPDTLLPSGTDPLRQYIEFVRALAQSEFARARAHRDKYTFIDRSLALPAAVAQAFARDELILTNPFSLSDATKPATLTLITRAAFGADLSAYVRECAADAAGDPAHRVLATRYRLPWCLVLLCDALLLSGGQQAEGCFRLSASTAEVARVRSDLNRGVYSPANSARLCAAVTGPHTLASLLKQFCRSLSPSLIPADLADCIRQLPSAAQITDALQLLSPEHCAAILFLVRFLREHFLDANVVQKTKMGLDNLVLILTPCIFGDRIDPAVANLGAEQTFVRRLLSELPPNAGVSLHDALQVSQMSSER